jgi:hypothetical protein
MAGNHNSGRKGYRVEIQAKKALELSFSTLIKVLEDETLDINLRLKAAIPIATKYFPEKIEVDDINQLTGEQKFILLNKYLDRFRDVKVIDADASHACTA